MRLKLATLLLVCTSLLPVPARAQVASADDVFPPDTADVLARFELNGNAQDSSPNGAHATLLGGEFESTCFGTGLRTRYSGGPMGFDWSAHAGGLSHPYTVEFVLRPDSTAPWGKLFSHADNLDSGWYYFQDGFQDYPNPVVGEGRMHAGSVHYLALVSLSADRVAVFFNGERVGDTDTTFTAPPGRAIFFRDDTATSRSEQFEGVVDAVRISKVARTDAEIAEQQVRVAARANTAADGLDALHGTPAEGTASAILQTTVAPAVGEANPEAGRTVHALGCVVAGAEDAVDATTP